MLPGGHKFRAAHRDTVVAVMFGELEETTVGGLCGIEQVVFFQKVWGHYQRSAPAGLSRTIP